MTYLFLTILFTSVLYVIFKKVSQNNIPLEPVLIINYWVAGVFCFAVAQKDGVLPIQEIKLFIPYFSVLGVIFIVIFRVMALTTQNYGVSTAAIASKMSLVIPVCAGLYFYQEKISLVQILGIMLALVSVYFSSTKKGESKIGWLPVILFIGSGVIDAYLKWIQFNFFPEFIRLEFMMGAFIMAGISGVFLFRKKLAKLFSLPILIWGSILGGFNFFSLYFIMESFIHIKNSSILFPLVNTGVVLLSTLFGLIIFKERLSRINYLGLVLSIVAILMLSFLG